MSISAAFDPYLGSQIKPDNALTHLWNYALGGAGLGPTYQRFGVPNATTPYRSTTGQYVGTDTSKVGGNNRNIDIGKLANQISSDYVGVDPTKQQVVTHGDDKYIIGKDQKVVGKQVLDKDAPTGVGRVIAGGLDAWDKLIPNWGGGTDKDRDKRDTATKIEDAQTTRKKTPADRLIEQQQMQTAYHQANQPLYDQMYERNMQMINQIGENQMARDLNYLKQAYPLQQAASWDATRRGLYGDLYSSSRAQTRAGQAALAESAMYGAVAQQANAAANLRGRYSGKNISIG